MEKYILIIDKNLRSISIPSEVKHIGVESDDAVNHIRFRMPQMYDGYDLSTFLINVNYENANGEGDRYIVEDAITNGGYIYFSWLVGRNACKYKGNVKFSICLKKMNDGVVIQEYNTMPVVLSVLEGLETTDAADEEYSDLLEQLIEKIDEANATITVIGETLKIGL